MENPLISVIVPVYKVEQYLERCVKSIVNQTYKNLEIILVDDGSPDRCPQMCDDFAKNDSRIRVIHKQNGGLSDARNAGLDVMTGEYVGFVDSDDWIEPDMYETLYKAIQDNNAQISTCVLKWEYLSGKFFCLTEIGSDLKSQVLSKIEALRELIMARKITNSACDKLFKANLFDNMRFKVGIVNEDFEMMPKCFDNVERVVFCPIPFYHYMMTDSSITRGAFKGSRFTELEISRKHMVYYKEKYPSLYKYSVIKHIELCLILLDESSKCDEFSEKRNEIIKELKNFNFTEYFKLLDKKFKVKYILFRISVKLYVFVMDLYKRKG